MEETEEEKTKLTMRTIGNDHVLVLGEADVAAILSGRHEFMIFEPFNLLAMKVPNQKLASLQSQKKTALEQENEASGRNIVGVLHIKASVF